MSETTSTETTQGAPNPSDVAEAAAKGKERSETPDQTIEALRAALAKANAEAKENRLKAAELDGVKRSQMSELEKAQAAAAEATARLAEFEKMSLRQKVAIEKGVPAKWVDRLKGDTEADLAADADTILADLVSAPATPKPDRTQGGTGAPLALNSDGLEAALRDKLGI